MTCYSSKYLGEKCLTYKIEYEKLLVKLVRKVVRKVQSIKLKDDKFFKFYTKGYSLNGCCYYLDKRFTVWEMEVDESYYEDFIFFDFEYETDYLVKNNIFDRLYEPSKIVKYRYNPRDLVLVVQEASMVEKTPILIEENKKWFRIIIPLTYYSYDENYTKENRKYKNGNIHP